jgi:SPP1 gp7 family putative phage head morphogenesis protein
LPLIIGDRVLGYDRERGTALLFARRAPQTDEEGLVKSKLVSALLGIADENPSALIRDKGLVVIDDMLGDECLSAGSSLKMLTVVGEGWEVISADANDGTANEQADLVRWNFENLPGSFKKAELGLLSGANYGYALSNYAFGTIEDGQFAGRLGIRTIKAKKPHAYKFALDEYGNITAIVQTDPDGREQKFDPAHWVIYTHDAGAVFGSPYGRSQLLACYRYWKLRKLLLPKRGMYVERVASGYPHLKYPTGLNATQAARYQTLLDSLQAGSGIATPNDVVIDFVEKSGSSHEEFEKLDNYCQRAMLRALLIPSELGIGPEAVVGSMAKAKVHEIVFDWVRSDMDSTLTTVVNEQLVRPLVDANYEVRDGRYPLWRHRRPDDDTAIERVTAFVTAVEKGVVGAVSRDDENQVRMSLGWPEISEDDWLEREAEKERRRAAMREQMGMGPGPEGGSDDGGGASARVPQAQKPRGGAGPGSPESEPGEPKIAEASELARPQRPETEARITAGLRDNPAYMRELTAAEKAVGFKPRATAELLSGIQAEGVRRVEAAMDRVRQKLVAKLRKAGLLDGTAKQAELYKFGGLDGQGKGEFREAMQGVLLTGYISGAMGVREEVTKATKGAAEFSAPAEPVTLELESLINTEALAHFKNLVPLSADTVNAYKAEAFWIAGLLEDDGEVLRRVKSAIARGFVDGNWRAVEGKVNAIFDEWSATGRVGDAGVAVPSWRTETIVRNAAMRSFNAGRWEQMQAADEWIEAYEWSSVIDERTTDYCESMDGKVFLKGEVELPPAHHNCRSVIIPVITGTPFSPTGADRLRAIAAKRDPDFTSGIVE